jgi:hypothetical protein
VLVPSQATYVPGSPAAEAAFAQRVSAPDRPPRLPLEEAEVTNM